VGRLNIVNQGGGQNYQSVQPVTPAAQPTDVSGILYALNQFGERLENRRSLKDQTEAKKELIDYETGALDTRRRDEAELWREMRPEQLEDFRQRAEIESKIIAEREVEVQTALMKATHEEQRASWEYYTRRRKELRREGEKIAAARMLRQGQLAANELKVLQSLTSGMSKSQERWNALAEKATSHSATEQTKNQALYSAVMMGMAQGAKNANALLTGTTSPQPLNQELLPTGDGQVKLPDGMPQRDTSGWPQVQPGSNPYGRTGGTDVEVPVSSGYNRSESEVHRTYDALRKVWSADGHVTGSIDKFLRAVSGVDRVSDEELAKRIGKLGPDQVMLARGILGSARAKVSEYLDPNQFEQAALDMLKANPALTEGIGLDKTMEMLGQIRSNKTPEAIQRARELEPILAKAFRIMQEQPIEQDFKPRVNEMILDAYRLRNSNLDLATQKEGIQRMHALRVASIVTSAEMLGGSANSIIDFANEYWPKLSPKVIEEMRNMATAVATDNTTPEASLGRGGKAGFLERIVGKVESLISPKMQIARRDGLPDPQLQVIDQTIGDLNNLQRAVSRGQIGRSDFLAEAYDEETGRLYMFRVVPTNPDAPVDEQEYTVSVETDANGNPRYLDEVAPLLAASFESNKAFTGDSGPDIVRTQEMLAGQSPMYGETPPQMASPPKPEVPETEPSIRDRVEADRAAARSKFAPMIEQAEGRYEFAQSAYDEYNSQVDEWASEYAASLMPDTLYQASGHNGFLTPNQTEERQNKARTMMDNQRSMIGEARSKAASMGQEDQGGQGGQSRPMPKQPPRPKMPSGGGMISPSQGPQSTTMGGGQGSSNSRLNIY
jgi:hypothetical protein